MIIGKGLGGFVAPRGAEAPSVTVTGAQFLVGNLAQWAFSAIATVTDSQPEPSLEVLDGDEWISANSVFMVDATIVAGSFTVGSMGAGTQWRILAPFENIQFAGGAQIAVPQSGVLADS